MTNIYHYTSLKTASIIIDNMSLLFNQLKKVDDPRESKNWHFDFLNPSFSDYSDFDVNHATLKNELNSFIKNKVKLSCFAQDDKDITDERYYHYHFKKGYGKSRMWSQYGDNHKGVCLAFDKEELVKRVKQNANWKCLEGEVAYCNHSEDFLKARKIDFRKWISCEKKYESYVDLIFERKNSFFFTKNLDYRDENEFRIVVLSEDEWPKFIGIGGCLKEIYLGVDIEENMKQQLVTKIKEKLSPGNYTLAKMSWQEGRPVPMFDI